MEKLILLLMFALTSVHSTTTTVDNVQQTNYPVIAGANASCLNKFCVTIRGSDFAPNVSVRVRENLFGSSTTNFSGNHLY